MPRIRDVEVVRGLLELHGVTGHRRRRATASWSSTRPTWSAPASTRSTCTPARAASRSCSAARCCTGSATRSSPTWAAATSAPRPIDFHIQALREFGAVVDKTPEGLHLTAPNGLHGTKFELPYPSVGATEQVLLTAVLAEGVTELRNAAVEPEIIDLICVLQKMGAIIKVHTDRVIEIEGVPRLRGYTPPPDPGPDRGGQLGRGGAGHRRRHRTCAAPAQADMMTFLNVFRSVGGAFEITDDPPAAGHRRRHPVLAPGRRAAARSRWRPTCTPAS